MAHRPARRGAQPQRRAADPALADHCRAQSARLGREEYPQRLDRPCRGSDGPGWRERSTQPGFPLLGARGILFGRNEPYPAGQRAGQSDAGAIQVMDGVRRGRAGGRPARGPDRIGFSDPGHQKPALALGGHHPRSGPDKGDPGADQRAPARVSGQAAAAPGGSQRQRRGAGRGAPAADRWIETWGRGG